jgi:glutamate-ammonia-ligase adenylyltransferase
MTEISNLQHCWQTLLQECAAEDKAFFEKTKAENSHSHQLLNTLFSCSPYLTRLCWQYPRFVREVLEQGIPIIAEQWRSTPLESPTHEEDKTLMATLRRHKSKGALLIAMADISSEWNLPTVTSELTLLAERTLQASLNHLWKRLEIGGHIKPTSRPCEGLIVLGMGKLGGYELNYSSDVDLVMLYDAEKIEYTGRQSLQHCLNRLSQDLVRLMQERTAEGYVFRVDLRLRPDPSSTPPVVRLDAAMQYYETVGQNWERAAFIKARPVAGDIAAGESFLKELRPFLWRKHLDFAAIADIQSIKRQMDHREMEDFTLAGHNIKRGAGGIREIEFIAQIHQLIWGGRVPSLRIRGTCEALRELAKLKLIASETVEKLVQHYEHLRMVEHRIQMMEDQQTHTVPEAEKDRLTLARFCGF